MPLKYHSLNEISEIHARLTKTFESGKTLPLEYRRKQLLALAHLIKENADTLMAAEFTDLGKHKLETSMAELSPMMTACLQAANSLEEWTKPEKPKVEEWRSSWDTTVYKGPKGTVVNISPWNYPVIISLAPLVGAIAAGCTCAVKPSETVPTVATVLAELFPKYLDTDAYAIINGAVDETTRVLELKWDHIFYTGSTRIGRIVATAAAKQLTPVTLELGGKSPVVVDATNTDIEIAAKRILWGKSQNTGQVCVSPDYVLVPRSQQDALVAAFKKAQDTFWPYPKGALDEKSDLACVITPATQERLSKLVAGTKGKVVMGGKTEGRRMEITIVKDVKLDDILMEEEIFGPILPIVPVDDVNEALRVVRGMSSPLVIYLFTEAENTKQLFLLNTRSGQLTLNDTFGQLAVYEIPFGGVGNSGYGAYFGKYSFDSFTNNRGYINVPLQAEPYMALRYSPYTDEAFQFMSAGCRAEIPSA